MGACRAKGSRATATVPRQQRCKVNANKQKLPFTSLVDSAPNHAAMPSPRGIAHLTVHCVLPIVGRHDLRPKAAISVKGFTSGSSYKCAVTASNSSSEGSNSKSSDIFIALSNALSAPTSVILIPTSSQSSAAFTKGTTRTPTPYTASPTAGSTTATTSANDVCIGPSYLF